MSAGMLYALLANGSVDDLREFFATVGPDERTALLSSNIFNQICRPLELCLLFDNDEARAAVLIDAGSPLITPEASQAGSWFNPTSAATLAANVFQSTAILRLVINKAQTQGCLSAFLCREPLQALTSVFQSDNAAVIDVLLTAGLNIAAITKVGEPHCTHSAFEILSDAVRYDPVACLRAFHSRLPLLWDDALNERANGRAVLLSAALSAHAYKTFYFLASLYPAAASVSEAAPQDNAAPQPAGPTSAAELLAPLLSRATFSSQSGAGRAAETDAEAARRALAAWDPLASAEIAVLETLSELEPGAQPNQRLTELLSRCGPRLACAILGTLYERHESLDGLLSIKSPSGLPLLLRHPQATEAMVAAVARTEARRLQMTEAACTTAAADLISVKVDIRQLLCPLGNAYAPAPFERASARASAGASARVLLAAGARLHAEPSPKTVLDTPFFGVANAPPAEGLLTASLCVTALAAEGILDAHVTPFSVTLLRDALEERRMALAQLYVDNGADVFHADTNGTCLLRELLKPTTTPTFGAVFTAFHGEAAYLTSLGVAEPVTEADASACQTLAEVREHAAAAAAMEQQLLSLLLHKPDLLYVGSREPAFALAEWAQCLEAALGLRWLWARMCERDGVRAQQCFTSTDPAEPLSPLETAAKNGNVWAARFLVSVGARLASAAPLAQACFGGRYALAWVLIDALRDMEPRDRARALTRSYDVGGTVLAGLLTAASLGYRFHRGLADALVDAGAEITALDVRLACIAPVLMPGIPVWQGESRRALRWALQTAQRQVDGPRD